jgi:hypothetical protein
MTSTDAPVHPVLPCPGAVVTRNTNVNRESDGDRSAGFGRWLFSVIAIPRDKVALNPSRTSRTAIGWGWEMARRSQSGAGVRMVGRSAIVRERPADWFTPATARLLRRYVRLAIYSEKLHDLLDAQPVGSEKAGQLLAQTIAVTSSLGVLAAKMRLSTQVVVSARSTGKMAQQGSPIALDPLIGTKLRAPRAPQSGFPRKPQ